MLCQNIKSLGLTVFAKSFIRVLTLVETISIFVYNKNSLMKCKSSANRITAHETGIYQRKTAQQQSRKSMAQKRIRKKLTER